MSLETPLAGRIALVTGAGSGIGAAIARDFAAAGSFVLVQDINETSAGVIAAEIDNSGGQASPVGGDISNPSDITTIVSRCVDVHGRVDILVNNAGVQFVAPLDEYPLEQWNRLLGILLTGPFLLTQAVLPSMRQNKWGRIINIASVNGKRGEIGKSAYCSAKHGIIGLTRVAALETATDGITVNAICPGLVDTPLIHNQLKSLAVVNGIPEEEALERVFLASIPQKRMLDPSEIASTARFLASEDARGITGQAINVSAGLLMH